MKWYRRVSFTQKQLELLSKLRPKRNFTAYLSTKGIYNIDNGNGVSFKMKSNNTVMDNRLMRKGLFYNEPNSKKIWMQWCREAKTVADVGANIGQFSLMALSSNPDLELIAIEALFSNMDMLQENISLNNGFMERTNLVKKAVGKEPGIFSLFYDPKNPLTPSLINKEGFTQEIQVNVVPFNTITDKKVDAIKIDVEGVEVDVIEGMLEYLKIYKPKIIIEILDDNKVNQINQILSAIGYTSERILENHGASKNFTYTLK